jgi:Flp pilus assembly protein TadG
VRSQHRGRWGQRGSAILEFVVILPGLLLIMFGTIEVSRLWLVLGVASEAAREAARMGAVSVPFSNTAAEARIDDLLAGVNMSATAKSVGCPSPCAAGATVTSSVSVQFQTSIPLLTPIFGASGITVQQTAQMRKE